LLALLCPWLYPILAIVIPTQERGKKVVSIGYSMVRPRLSVYR
jgi:hypothetical protein